MLTGSTNSLLASAAAIAASTGFVAVMLRHRGNPTTRPLTVLAIALQVGAVVHFATVELAPVRAALGIHAAPTDALGGVWMLVAFDLAAVVGGLWFLFALQYTGRGERTTPVANAVVAALLVSLLGSSVGLAVSSQSFGVSTDALNLVLGITLILAEAVALLGMFLVLAATLRTKAVPAGQTTLLALPVGAVLVLPFVATTFQSPVATPVAVAAASSLLTGALFRYRVFDTLPAATVVGRDRVVDEMTEAILVVDADDRVRDVNPVAETLLGVDHSAVGRLLEDVVPALARSDAANVDEPFDVRLDASVASVTIDSVTDTEGRSLGRLFVCRDVTAQRERENRLAVLTQLAAGGTQRQLAGVAETADEVVRGERLPSAAGTEIRDTATTVATLVARVRDVERALANAASDEPQAIDAEAVVWELDTPGGLTVSTRLEGDANPIAASTSLLTATLEILLAAVATNADAATVRAVGADESIAFCVSPWAVGEDGSVADHARQVAQLAADHAGWTVRDGPDGDGSEIAVRVPAADSPGAPGGDTR